MAWGPRGRRFGVGAGPAAAAVVGHLQDASPAPFPPLVKPLCFTDVAQPQHRPLAHCLMGTAYDLQGAQVCTVRPALFFSQFAMCFIAGTLYICTMGEGIHRTLRPTNAGGWFCHILKHFERACCSFVAKSTLVHTILRIWCSCCCRRSKGGGLQGIKQGGGG